MEYGDTTKLNVSSTEALLLQLATNAAQGQYY